MKRNLSLTTLLLVAILLLCSTNVVFSSEVFPEIYPDTYSLDNPLMYIFLATVDQIIPNPDKKSGPEDSAGILNVTEVIRGHNIAVGKISARWNLNDNPIAVARNQPPQNPRPLKVEDKEALKTRVHHSSGFDTDPGVMNYEVKTLPIQCIPD